MQRRHQGRSVHRSGVREPRDLTRPPLASLSRRGAEADRLFDLDEQTGVGDIPKLESRT
jgi:hypothetical protein